MNEINSDFPAPPGLYSRFRGLQSSILVSRRLLGWILLSWPLLDEILTVQNWILASWQIMSWIRVSQRFLDWIFLLAALGLNFDFLALPGLDSPFLIGILASF